MTGNCKCSSIFLCLTILFVSTTKGQETNSYYHPDYFTVGNDITLLPDSDNFLLSIDGYLTFSTDQTAVSYILKLDASGNVLATSQNITDTATNSNWLHSFVLEDGRILAVSQGQAIASGNFNVAYFDSELQLLENETYEVRFPDAPGLRLTATEFHLIGDKIVGIGTHHPNNGPGVYLYILTYDYTDGTRELLTASTRIQGLYRNPFKHGANWLISDNRSYTLDSTFLGVVEFTDDRELRLTEAGATHVTFSDSLLYSYGQTTYFDNRNNIYRGARITKLDANFNVIAQDTMKLRRSSPENVYPGRTSLITNHDSTHLYAVGADYVNRQAGSYPKVIQNSELFLRKYDLDLNLEWEKLYNHDAFYEIMDIAQLNTGNIAISGFRYFDETDVFEGFLLIINEEDGTVANETVFAGPPRLSVEVFPNPVTDRVNLRLPATYNATPSRLSVFDAAGRLMIDRTNDRARQSIDVSSWPKGTYSLRWVTDRGIGTGRFVKQ